MLQKRIQGQSEPTALCRTAAAAAKSLQLCPTLCDPIDSSPPGSSVQGIFQARVLEWGAIAFSTAGLQRVFMEGIPISKS